ncbi:WapI family immunity protein [Streptomyces sp. CA-288835]|uniref:WapI family immunity protein n=1 Tax=Streptomyces sp. CA-288835 TaxID=3240069 RepID=UPI003D8A0DFF
MRLTDRVGGIVLRPLRYQFPVASGDRWDDNWLVVEAEVITSAANWSFTDPCLLVDEAHELSAWLRAVADGRRPDAKPDPEGLLVPDLSFLEPDLAFSQVRWHDGTGVLRVHLSLEAAPPRRRHDENLDLYQYVVEIETDRATLMRAAEEWDQHLAQFPLR